MNDALDYSSTPSTSHRTTVSKYVVKRSTLVRQFWFYIIVLLVVSHTFIYFNSYEKYAVDAPRTNERNQNNEAHDCINRTETHSIGKDWYAKDRFNENFEGRCLVVDNICHSSGRWWYKPLADGVEGNQPSFSFHTSLDGAVGYPEIVDVTSSSDSYYDSQMISNLQCAVSPIINHIVMYSYYNTMLGEFYFRVLRGLFVLSQTQSDDYIDFLQQTQLYLHMYNNNYKPMLNSHHTFTEAFRGHPLLDVKVMFDNSGCQCLQRLFLCGYSFTPSEHDAVNITFSNQSIAVTPGDGIYPKSTNHGWKEMRNALRKHILEENLFIQQDVEQYRENVLRSKGVEKDFDEWKLIGLSQRSGRRRWNNLNEVEQECDLVFRQHKIICTEINIEREEFRPYHHAVAHGGLDALFGIHGAQLTEALLMKPGSLVVEFLPWVHEAMIMGGWTRMVQEPTPVGVMFSGTDLNHIGFPLTRHSAPYCYGLDKDEELNCWRDNWWDSRDFVAPAMSVVDSVATFFVNATANPQSCAMYDELVGDEFVLYNIQCKGNFSSLDTAHQFFWKQRLEDIPKYAEYSNDLPKQ